MIKLIDPFKAQVFVAHIQNHLSMRDWPMAQTLNKIPEGEVGCKICEKGIERIYNEEKEKWSR